MEQSPSFSWLLTLTAQPGSEARPFAERPRSGAKSAAVAVRAALAAARAGWVRTTPAAETDEKKSVIVRNIGHFDNEIDMSGLEGMQADIVKPEVGLFGFFNGHGEIVLASEHHLGCATDHPSFSTSCSFTDQVLAQLDLLRKWKKTTA